MQNLVTIPQGVYFPRMREIAHQNVTRLLFSGFFQRPTASAPEPIFTLNKLSNDVRGSVQGCAFLGLETKNLTFSSIYFRNIFWARFSRDKNRQQQSKTALQWGWMFHVKSP